MRPDNRLFTINELTRLTGVSRYDLSLALDIHRVRPAFRVGRREVGLYTPDQVNEIRSMLRGQ